MVKRSWIVLALELCIFVGAASAEPPSELWSRLHAQVAGQRVLTYAEVWQALPLTDGIPGNAGRLRLVYTERSEDVDHRDHGQNDPDSWNREHLWPKSRGFSDPENPAYTDLHNLRPADRSVNTDRNNRESDDGGRPHPEATGVRWDSDSWEVPDDIKGDVARALFYMALRYDGTETWIDRQGKPHRDSHLSIQEAASTRSKNPTLGHLSTLLRWNRQDHPDATEQRRESVVEALQGRSNPFVEHPEWVDVLWGGSTP